MTANIDQEIDNIAESLAKSSAVANFTPDLLKATIREMGVSGLKAIIPSLNAAQKVLLKSVIEDMQKASNVLDLNPKNKDLNLEKPKARYTEADEALADEAKKKKQDEINHQGDDSVQEGQVIKAEVGLDMSEKDKKLEVLEKPPVSQAQRAAMHAAAEGDSTIGISAKVGKEFAEKDPGGKLPEHKTVKKSDGDADYAVDGDRNEQSSTGGTKCEAKSPQSTDEKKQSKKEPIMSMEDKKSAAKKNLHGMMKRMQDRKMEKALCVAKLAENMNVDASKIDQLWDLVAKSDVLCDSCGKKPEDHQVAPCEMVKTGGKAKPTAPASGKAKETADEGEQAPNIKKGGPGSGPKKGSLDAIQKSDSFFYEDETFYTPKNPSNPFTNRTHGQNVTYSVDKFVEEATTAQVNSLAKSNFFYTNEDVKAKPASYIDDLIANHMDHDDRWTNVEEVVVKASPLTKLVKSFKNEDLDDMMVERDSWGIIINKAVNPAEEAMAQQVRDNAKAQAESKRKEEQDQRDAKIDSKLTLIDEHAGRAVNPQMVKCK